MCQIQFPLGELIQRWIKGPSSKGREWRLHSPSCPLLSPPLEVGEGKGGEGKGGEGRDPTPSRLLIHISGYVPEIITIITPIMSCYHYNTTRNQSESANFGHDI